jgi:homoserine O-acetyltransferase
LAGYSLEAVTPKIFQGCEHQQYLVFSIDSDVCFYPEEQFAIVKALEAAAVPVKYITVHSNKGHDSFLLEPELYSPYIRFALTDGCFGSIPLLQIYPLGQRWNEGLSPFH